MNKSLIPNFLAKYTILASCIQGGNGKYQKARGTEPPSIDTRSAQVANHIKNDPNTRCRSMQT